MTDDPLIELGGSGRRRNRVAVAVVLVTGLVGGVLVARHDSTSTGAASSTTAASSTVVPTTSTTARSTTASSTTTIPVVVAGSGPLLPEPTGQSIYVAGESGDIHRVDLDTGAVTHYQLEHRFPNVVGIAALDNAALVFDGFDYGVDAGPLYRPGGGHVATLFQLKPDGTLSTIHLEVAAAQRLADAGGGGAWLIGRNANGMPAALVDATGASTVFIDIPTGLNPIVADGGGIVATGTSGAFRVDQAGPRQLTTGTLIGLSAHYLVASTCDEHYQCTVTRTDRDTGHVDDLGPMPASLGAGSVPGVVSPDGDAVALIQVGTNPSLVYYDLATGEVTEISTQVHGPANNLAWTSTGWLVVLNAGVLELTRGDERRYVDLGAGRSTASLIGLAIGPTPTASEICTTVTVFVRRSCSA